MIDYIKGNIVNVDESANIVIIESSNIGYEIQFVGDVKPSCGETVKMYICISKSEFCETYYGFLTENVRNVFKSILKVKRVGFKRAALIMNKCGFLNLTCAIVKKDSSFHIPYIPASAKEQILKETIVVSKDVREIYYALKELGFTSELSMKHALHYEDGNIDTYIKEICIKK